MAACRGSVGERAIAITWYPAALSAVAIPSPKPRLAPVTMTLRTGAHQLSGRRDLKRRHETDHGGDLEGCQGRLALGSELPGKVRSARARAMARHLVCQHDVGRDDGAGDRIAARLDQRHANPRMG